MAEVNPDLTVYLAANGVFKDGQPDRTWFEESCARSEGFIALGKAERDKELQRILDEEL
jgi:hypothetical protein